MTEEERNEKFKDLKGKKYGNAHTNIKITKNMKTGINSDKSIDCSGFVANVINSESDVGFKLPNGGIAEQKDAFRAAEKQGKAEYIAGDNVDASTIQDGDVVFTNEGGNHGYVAGSDAKSGSVSLMRASSGSGKVKQSSFQTSAGSYLSKHIVAIGRPNRTPVVKLADVQIALPRQPDASKLKPMQITN